MGLFNKRDKDRSPALPTVKFDASQVTDTMEADVRTVLAEVSEFDATDFPAVLDAALRSIGAGRDLHTLSQALSAAGLNKKRAGQVAIHIHNRATSAVTRARQSSLGTTEAAWLYSGAPCYDPRGKVTPEDVERDAAHKAANGQRYLVSQGLKLGERSVWPGQELGCKCVSNSIIPGFD